MQVVGHGTPAAKAGLKPGDLIVALDEKSINSAQDLRDALKKTKPNRQVTLTVKRDGQQRPLSLPVTLGRRPLQVVRPEAGDPLSFRLTLKHIEGEGIKTLTLKEPEALVEVGEEPDGLDLWTGNWEVEQTDRTHVRFVKRLPELGLEIAKTYWLKPVPEKSMDDPNGRGYHLEFEVEIRNTSGRQRIVAYQLDGPTGLPTEGSWYAYKVGPEWGTAGLRDVVVSLSGRDPSWVYCSEIADADADIVAWKAEPLTFIGVDAQYFSCVLRPQKDEDETWFAESHPLLVGKVDPGRKNVTNTSCRLIGKRQALASGGVLRHRFEIFAGPKKPDLLAPYQLDELVYYGWFSWIAEGLGGILHLFGRVGNYGVAILLLTVLVRGCMFPLSRKQAIGAQKMQELQPELKRIREKHKNDMQVFAKAQQELFRKNNCNPYSGCLVLFIQLPVFVALYRLLSVDIELRQAPLISESVRWCSNLAAPDMLFDWSSFWNVIPLVGPSVAGWSPYFNLLPIFTIILFIVQQKMFMPPPTDDQQAMQQKIMKYMMIFIGFMFFKVASGLCLYFIASSLWGVAERKFLPKRTPVAPTGKPRTRAEAKAEAKPQSESAPGAKQKPAKKPAALDGDGAAAAKKRRKKNQGRR